MSGVTDTTRHEKDAEAKTSSSAKGRSSALPNSFGRLPSTKHRLESLRRKLLIDAVEEEGRSMNGGGLFDKFAFGGMAKGNKVRTLALSAAGRSAKRRKPESGTTAVKASTSAASQPGGGDGRTKPAGGLLPKLGSRPLRLILVGHNPSAHAWSSGHYYSHPGNRMWPILRETGIAPADLVRGCEDDGSMPESCGVGFIDVGVGHPGTDSSKIDLRDEKFHGGFYAHLRDHLELAGAPPRIVGELTIETASPSCRSSRPDPLSAQLSPAKSSLWIS